jgi:hypothetical protein
MGASDFRSPLPSSSLFRLVRRCALLPAPTIGSPWLPRTLVVRLDAVFDPGVAPRASRCARDAVACWSEETIGQHTNASISGLNYLQGQHYLGPLHLASFCAYASSTPLPECLQGSIPGPWLAVTWAGFAPARLRGIAKPRPPVASGWSDCRVGLTPTGKRRLITAHTPSRQCERQPFGGETACRFPLTTRKPNRPESFRKISVSENRDRVVPKAL